MEFQVQAKFYRKYFVQMLLEGLFVISPKAIDCKIQQNSKNKKILNYGLSKIFFKNILQKYVFHRKLMKNSFISELISNKTHDIQENLIN